MGAQEKDVIRQGGDLGVSVTEAILGTLRHGGYCQTAGWLCDSNIHLWDDVGEPHTHPSLLAMKWDNGNGHLSIRLL